MIHLFRARITLNRTLWQQAQTLIQQGWVASMDELIAESVRRYLESHAEALSERFLREDLEWGLHGAD